MDLAQGDGRQLVLAHCRTTLEAAERQRHSQEKARRCREAAQRKTKRVQAKKHGLCQNCCKKPAVLQRLTCRDCLMDRLIREAFKFDRSRRLSGITTVRGTCYVDWFTPKVRSEWVQQVISKFNGTCFYTGLPIEIGSTAGLDHMLPVSRAAAFGPSKVFHPDNLVWAHKSINILKGEKTAEEFLYWLRTDFRQHLEGMGHL